MAALTIQSIAETLDSNLSWNTKLSRTRVSTVDGLACTESSDAAVQTLEGVLRMVKRLKLRQCQFSDIEELEPKVGEGETFVVDRCKLNGKVVAVKHIKLGDYNVDQRAFHWRLQSVVREISIMHHQPLAQHPHILQLLGYGWKLEGSSLLPYIVVEYGIGGDLRSYLQSHPQSSLKSKITHCGDVACGLMALHQCGIVHGDLKLNNVIIFESWDRPSGTIAKLCDFGHSILLAVENPSQLRYVGTTLYNAPEVAKQRHTPIDWENLHKCDIWSYGLLVWEILANGEIYFKRKWRHDPNFARTTREALSGTTLGDSRCPTTREEAQEESIQPEEEGVMGTFDSKHLRNLATQFVNTMQLPIFEKGCLGPLFKLTLQEDPALRLSDLNRLPIVSVWNKSGASSLQHKLAMHVGTSEFTFEMFQGRDIPWEHQVSMLSDFERVASLRQGGEQSTAAAFHVALCYILGFGTKVEYSTATQYLRKAEEQAHPLAQLFSPKLLSRISNLPNPGLVDYTSIVHKGFRAKRFFSRNTKISLTTGPAKSTDCELSGLELDTDASQPRSFANFQDFLAWQLAFIRLKGDLTQWQVTIGTGPKMNFLECAIAFADTALLSHLLSNTDSDWDRIGAWGETPLVQATRRGSAKMVLRLLNASHDPARCDESGASVYHWLFSLTADSEEANVDSVLTTLFLHPHAAEAIERACTTPYVLHAQWPLQLLGTPLAFAVSSGSLKTVEALLQHGVDPRAPVYAAAEDGVRSKWTALHLATKYHFPQILTALVQKADEIVRSSHNPLKELGISMARNPFRNPEWKGREIPEALLAEALLEFPDLQLPCVLGHITTLERYGIHGGDYRRSIVDVLDILPSRCLEWRCSDGQTALMQAIDNNDYDLASVLLDHSPHLASAAFRDPTEKGAHTYPFHFACQIASRCDSEETTDIASRILQLHPEAVRDKDSRLRTALHMSVTGSSSRVTKFLLFHEAPKDAEDIDGASPLHYARSLANVVALLDHGAMIDYTNKKGLAAIHLAASIGADDIVAELVKRGAKLDLSNNDLGSPLHCAVIKKSKACVYSLVQGNAPINARDRDNNTPLILATQSGRNDIVQILLEHGADVSLQNNSRVTPLRAAVLTKSPALVEKLLNHNVYHLAQETSSQTILHLAAAQADAATIRVLLDKLLHTGVLSINAVNGTLQTPLHVAALAARVGIAQVLLEYKPKIDTLDVDGATPLLAACRSSKQRVIDANGNRTEFVDLLVEKGADLRVYDYKEQGAWVLAREYQDFNLMAYILDKLSQMDCLHDHVTYKDPVDRELIEWAIQQDEWDFVTTCLGTGAIGSKFLPQSMAKESRTNIDRLYAYAKRGDKDMVQWVLEASRNGSLSNSTVHTRIRYTGMRNMYRYTETRNLYLEFHESLAPSGSTILFVPPSSAPHLAKDLESPRVSNFLDGMLRKRSSTPKPSLEIGECSSNPSDLLLTPTSTMDSSSHSPSRLRTPSFGSSLENLLQRVTPGEVNRSSLDLGRFWP
ncbi:hypothetical protein EPUS_03848 [Endocarpon pusillum Z07020]|uniref:Protein kinase domain-containing protein n=1 Tax=Endocarpon pusillum (strain Z07020 / HMAS-L-300199) TaxID=1263415 RepID=U1GP04_ENDPU|nr:uncharacterized protein EPUS_03848 [Endocarpon pusillum Z07020]ERF74033.1 hypothetical protein EPUS_03848 [Endocarpon pusillum Z07020]